MTAMTMSGYLELSEETNALDYLEKAVAFVKSAGAHPVDWKWVILSTHAALYGFMICTLTGTNPDNVCTKSKKGESKLIDFPTAFKWCQDGSDHRMYISGFTRPLKVTEEQKKAVQLVHKEFRNEFAHYQPKLWFIQLAGIPRIICDVFDVIRMVTLEMGCYYPDYGPTGYKRIEALIAEGQAMLATAADGKLR